MSDAYLGAKFGGGVGTAACGIGAIPGVAIGTIVGGVTGALLFSFGAGEFVDYLYR